jgi:hypothetical protein
MPHLVYEVGKERRKFVGRRTPAAGRQPARQVAAVTSTVSTAVTSSNNSTVTSKVPVSLM